MTFESADEATPQSDNGRPLTSPRRRPFWNCDFFSIYMARFFFSKPSPPSQGFSRSGPVVNVSETSVGRPPPRNIPSAAIKTKSLPARLQAASLIYFCSRWIKESRIHFPRLCMGKRPIVYFSSLRASRGHKLTFSPRSHSANRR